MGAIWRVAKGGLTSLETVEDVYALMLSQRGISLEGADNFFAPTYETDIHDPWLLLGMQEAVDRIYHAVKRGERVLVYGDYDADGVTSTAELITTLREIGASATAYLPHRLDDGYGLNQSVLENLLSEIDVVVTVDCGVANVAEIAWLKSKGKDVLVVDHHEIGEVLPDARAILHPRHPDGQYPWGHLCGAGVAWKFCQALLRDKRSPFAGDVDKEKWLLDLAVLGTVADVMPLLGENRAIVKFGLQVLQMQRRPGVKALLNHLKVGAKPLTTEDVGFKIVPRLNAPGRLEHAQPALDLLLSQDAASAERHVQVLEVYNAQRQTISRRIAKEAEAQIVADAPVVFAFHAAWPAGVVGLVAGQLSRKFSRPAVVVGGNGRHGVGSARSPKGYHILNILESGREHLLKLGGHAQAAGFSVEEKNIHQFYRAIVQSPAATTLADSGEVVADAVLHHGLLNWNMADAIQKFGPFGEANREPVFMLKNVPLLKSQPVGKKQDHAKFIFDVGTKLDAIGFGLASKIEGLGDAVDVVGSLSIDRSWGAPRLQLRVDDIMPAGSVRVEEAQ
ncbi:MAG: single-stranded-DNA-specific exonuclease RecJ [Candidatus Andersenbacteria bacterium]|nr:single-stranded-DNA-specific exonuclease RecJ [Candidatus Andersenbacteria bacterium]